LPARDLPPNYKLVGNILTEDPKPLSKEWQDFMDSHSEGVIIFSFGTFTIGTDQMEESIMNVFSKLPYQFIWRYPIFPHVSAAFKNNLPKNIRFEKYIPQLSLFHHKNTKLFITHCGANGIYEAITGGVPMLGIPFLADQEDNSILVRDAGIGKSLYKSKFTEHLFSEGITDILKNHSHYSKNALKIASLFKQEKGIEEIGRWVDYTIQFGTDHLKPKIRSLPWYTAWLIDVYAFLFGLVVVTYFIFKKICCGKKKKESNTPPKTEKTE